MSVVLEMLETRFPSFELSTTLVTVELTHLILPLLFCHITPCSVSGDIFHFHGLKYLCNPSFFGFIFGLKYLCPSSFFGFIFRFCCVFLLHFFCVFGVVITYVPEPHQVSEVARDGELIGHKRQADKHTLSAIVLVKLAHVGVEICSRVRYEHDSAGIVSGEE